MTVSLDRLVQAHARVSVRDVGTGQPARARSLQIAGRTVGLVGGAGSTRSYFICPNCGARRSHLYLMPAPTCRVCADLDYASRWLSQGSIVHTVIRLRRQIPGAEPEPFGRLPKFWRHFVRRQRLVDQVRELEAEHQTTR